MWGCSGITAPASRSRSRVSSWRRGWSRAAAPWPESPELSIPWTTTTPSTASGKRSKISSVTRRPFISWGILLLGDGEFAEADAEVDAGAVAGQGEGDITLGEHLSRRGLDHAGLGAALGVVAEQLGDV